MSSTTQVAVKVLRGGWSDAEFTAKLKKVQFIYYHDKRL